MLGTFIGIAISGGVCAWMRGTEKMWEKVVKNGGRFYAWVVWWYDVKLWVIVGDYPTSYIIAIIITIINYLLCFIHWIRPYCYCNNDKNVLSLHCIKKVVKTP